MRMRLGLLQDPAVIEKQIAKEVAEAEARRKRSQVPTVKTEAQTKAEEAMTAKEKETIKKKTEAAHKPRIRPLSEAKAIETGANFVSETFIFMVGIGVIVFEQWRQRRKQKSQRSELEDQLEALASELQGVKSELELIKSHQAPAPAPSTRLGFWKSKSESKSDQNSATDGATQATRDSSAPSPALPHHAEVNDKSK